MRLDGRLARCRGLQGGEGGGGGGEMIRSLVLWVCCYSWAAYGALCFHTRDSKPGSFAMNLSWQFIAARHHGQRTSDMASRRRLDALLCRLRPT
jgi:hypothetical protein